MEKPEEPIKIIWAIDAVHSQKALLQPVLQALTALGDRTSIRVDPVFVLAVDEQTQQLDREIQMARSELEPLSNRLSQARFECSHSVRIRSPLLLLHHGGGISDSESLSHYAARSDAELILVSTGGKTGFSKLVLGSFSEKLISDAPIPILLLTPHCHVEKNIQEVIFPTDLSPNSEQVFKRTLQTIRWLNAKLTLLHVREERSPSNGEAAKERARWNEIALGQGVPSEFVFHELRGSSKWEIIAEYASKRKGSVIMMPTHLSSKNPCFHESVTLKVIDHSQRPVWVYHLDQDA